MRRHGLHLRAAQVGGSDLPSSIAAPNTEVTEALPSAIVPTSITTDTAATGDIVSAPSPTAFTTVTSVFLVSSSISGGTGFTTETTLKPVTITDSAYYASLTAEAAKTASHTSSTLSSTTSSPAATSSAANHKSSNLGTLVPAIVVPIAVVLLSSFGLFWFYMRRRHIRELERQPEFVMAGKGEKLSSRSNSSRSVNSSREDKTWTEKKQPTVAVTAVSSGSAAGLTLPKYTAEEIGVARPLTPQDSQTPGSRPRGASPPSETPTTEPRVYRNFSGPRPNTAGRGPPPSSFGQNQPRSRSNSSPGQRGPRPPNNHGPPQMYPSRPGPSPTPRSAPSPVPQGRPSPPQGLPGHPKLPPTGGSPVPPSAFRFRDPSPSMSHNARANAPSRLEAPPPGAFNGASPISQFSPIVKDTPMTSKRSSNNAGKRNLLPPLQTSTHRAKDSHNYSSQSSPDHGLTEENMRIARLANSSRLGWNAPSEEPLRSPKLPPPATRSQLIPKESPREERGGYFGASGTNDAQPDSPSRREDGDERRSMISAPDDYEDIDAKSDVSSLHELDRFNFGDDGGNGRGHQYNYYHASSGTGSPFGERW